MMRCSARSFNEMGPSITLSNAMTLSGSFENGLPVDWDANGAILFGSQIASVRTRTDQSVSLMVYPDCPVTRDIDPVNVKLNAQKNVIVPNIGVFACVSHHVGYRGKIALGYCNDFF